MQRTCLKLHYFVLVRMSTSKGDYKDKYTTKASCSLNDIHYVVHEFEYLTSDSLSSSSSLSSSGKAFSISPLKEESNLTQVFEGFVSTFLWRKYLLLISKIAQPRITAATTNPRYSYNDGLIQLVPFTYTRLAFDVLHSNDRMNKRQYVCMKETTKVCADSPTTAAGRGRGDCTRPPKEVKLRKDRG